MTTVQSVNFIHRYYGHFSFDREKYMQYNDLILLVQGHIIMLQHQTATIRLHMVTVPSGCYLIFREKKKEKKHGKIWQHIFIDTINLLIRLNLLFYHIKEYNLNLLQYKWKIFILILKFNAGIGIKFQEREIFFLIHLSLERNIIYNRGKVMVKRFFINLKSSLPDRIFSSTSVLRFLLTPRLTLQKFRSIFTKNIAAAGRLSGESWFLESLCKKMEKADFQYAIQLFPLLVKSLILYYIIVLTIWIDKSI